MIDDSTAKTARCGTPAAPGAAQRCSAGHRTKPGNVLLSTSLDASHLFPGDVKFILELFVDAIFSMCGVAYISWEYGVDSSKRKQKILSGFTQRRGTGMRAIFWEKKQIGHCAIHLVAVCTPVHNRVITALWPLHQMPSAGAMSCTKCS